MGFVSKKVQNRLNGQKGLNFMEIDLWKSCIFIDGIGKKGYDRNRFCDSVIPGARL